MDALQKANEVRIQRSQLKRDLRAGIVTSTEVVSNPPEWALTMKLFDVVIATPKVGRVKTNKLFHAVRISPSKTIGGLSERQRLEVVAQLQQQQQGQAKSARMRTSI